MNFRIGRKLGEGSFGFVYKGSCIKTEKNVAIKMERVETKHNQLENESKIYKILEGGIGICNLYWFGVYNEYSTMVIDLLGPSLEDLFDRCERQFSQFCVMLIAEQIINRIQYIHSKGIIHRDIKPENFAIGKNNVIYILDFGLSKELKKNNKHISSKIDKNLVGTPRYASICNHMGMEQSRQDDLESIGYMLLYFCNGSLPWQGIRALNKKEKYEKIHAKKIETSLSELCKNVPNELYLYMKYCKQITSKDRPDYNYLLNLFKNAIVSNKYINSFNGYDWNFL